MRITSFLFVNYLAVTSALAETASVVGVWDGGGRAAEAIYRTLTITDTHISWPHTHNLPKCKAAYKIVLTESGDTYPDELAIFKNLAKDRTFATVRLELEQKKCVGSLGYLQFSIPSDIPGYADVVEYDRNGKPEGWIHFHKRK
jgi:hypothetical protein